MTHVRRREGPVASHHALVATQRHEGDDEAMNPAITTVNSALYGRKKDQGPSPQVLS